MAIGQSETEHKTKSTILRDNIKILLAVSVASQCVLSNEMLTLECT